MKNREKEVEKEKRRRKKERGGEIATHQDTEKTREVKIIPEKINDLR